MPYDEEIEIIEHKDGTQTIKVIRSKRNCHDVTKPFEEGKQRISDQAIANPGLKSEDRIRGTQ